MTITVYADFNQPLAYLLSQRVDRVEAATGQPVRWCAVQHERALPVIGRRVGEAEEHRLLDEVRRLARSDEWVPEHFAHQSNSCAMTSAYAEAVADGYEGPLRRALFASLYLPGAHLDTADEVRRVVVSVTLPETVDVATARTSRWAPLGVPDPTTVIRQLGGTTTRVGGPVTTAGQQRIDSWRRSWADRGAPEAPLLVSPLGEVMTAERALGYLSFFLPPAPRRTEHAGGAGELSAQAATADA